MTKRYYYTDPLAAAWMAKHFGMKLHSIHTDEQMADYDIPETDRNFDWFDSCIVDGFERDVEMVSDAIEYIEKASDCIYIHPDSLHLLEPQEGDAVEFDRWNWSRKREDRGFQDAPTGMDYGAIRKTKSTNREDGYFVQISSAGFRWDDNYSGRFSLPFKIIQRNGLAFHWPESEEA